MKLETVVVRVTFAQMWLLRGKCECVSSIVAHSEEALLVSRCQPKHVPTKSTHIFFSGFRIELSVHLPIHLPIFHRRTVVFLRLVASMSTGKTCRCWASWAFEGNAGLGRFPNIITL